MALLAQEVADGVAPLGDLVEARRDLAQLALGPDHAEVDREQPQQVQDEDVDGPHRPAQQRRDVALEEVGVGDEDAAEPQVDDERGEQRRREQGIDLDDREVGADALEVGGVDSHPPFTGEAGEFRVLEVGRERLVDEDGDEVGVAVGAHLASDAGDQVGHGAAMRRGALAQEAEHLADECLALPPVLVARGEHLDAGQPEPSEHLLLDSDELR